MKSSANLEENEKELEETMRNVEQGQFVQCGHAMIDDQVIFENTRFSVHCYYAFSYLFFV